MQGAQKSAGLHQICRGMGKTGSDTAVEIWTVDHLDMGSFGKNIGYGDIHLKLGLKALIFFCLILL